MLIALHNMMTACGFDEPSQLSRPFVFGCYIQGPRFCMWRLSADMSSIPGTESAEGEGLQEALVANCAFCDCHEGETFQQVWRALPQWVSPARKELGDLFARQKQGYGEDCYLCNRCGRWYHKVCFEGPLATGECCADCHRPAWNFVAQEIAVLDLTTEEGKEEHKFCFLIIVVF